MQYKSMHFLNLFVVLSIATIAFNLNFDWNILNPRNIAWLYRDDLFNAFVGWEFFRKEVWHFPLGKIQNLAFPYGTNIVVSGGIPLLFFPFKIISQGMSFPFQIIGWFVFACYLLHGLFAYLLVKRIFVTTKYFFIFITLGATLIIFCPVLFKRFIHPSTNAHWVVLATIYAYQTINPRKIVSSYALWIALHFLAISIDPYFLPATFCGLLAWSIRSVISKKASIHAYYIPAACTAFLVLTAYSYGYFHHLEIIKDNHWSTHYPAGNLDLATLFSVPTNSRIYRWFFAPSLYQGNSHEYLGIGLILCVLTSFVLLYKKPAFRRKISFEHGPIILIGLLLFIYTLGANLKFMDYSILNLKAVYPKDIPLASIFQTSYRLAWLPYYLLVVGSIYIIAKNLTVKKAGVLLSLVTVIQVADTAPEIVFKKPSFVTQNLGLLHLELPNGYKAIKKISLVPPILSATLPEEKKKLYREVATLAAKQQLKFNSGIVARGTSIESPERSKQLLQAKLRSGDLSSDTLYVLHDLDNLADYPVANSQKHCRLIRSYLFCLKNVNASVVHFGSP